MILRFRPIRDSLCQLPALKRCKAGGCKWKISFAHALFSIIQEPSSEEKFRVILQHYCLLWQTISRKRTYSGLRLRN